MISYWLCLIKDLAEYNHISPGKPIFYKLEDIICTWYYAFNLVNVAGFINFWFTSVFSRHLAKLLCRGTANGQWLLLAQASRVAARPVVGPGFRFGKEGPCEVYDLRVMASRSKTYRNIFDGNRWSCLMAMRIWISTTVVVMVSAFLWGHINPPTH